jgi:predicted TPR repeat methyltransferase
MIEKARARGIYNEVIVGDVMSPLGPAVDRYDLVISADVFVYMGDLTAVFDACARALRAGGLFALSAETGNDSTSYELRASGRYAHGDLYIRGLANQFGFDPLIMRDVVLRKEEGMPMAGRIYVLKKN